MKSVRWLLLVAAASCTREQPKGTGEPQFPVEDAARQMAQPDDWDREIRLKLADDENAAASVVEVSLTAKVARVPTGTADEMVERWTYNSTVPGPLIRAHVGDRLRVHFKNELPEATTVHWHGMEVPAAMDGADPSLPAIGPGESFDYEFVVPHAGTYWYHPHLNSAVQLWRGLFGALIVDDASEPLLGAEAVLVLNDTSLKDGRLREFDPGDQLTAFFGHEGDLMQVNGRTLPSFEVRSGSALRLRLINAALSRYFLLAIEGHELKRIAGDSGFLNRPEQRESILLVPGERAEVVVVPRGQVGTSFLLQSLPFDRFDCGGPCAPKPLPLARIEIVDEDGAALPLPEGPTPITPLDVSNALERSLALTQDMQTGRFGLNGLVYPEHPLVVQAIVGETDIWTVDNQTDYDHPFHLHGFRFQVLEQAGRKPEFVEWKDTLNVARRTKARLAVNFDDRPGMWMLHCHILGHADLGMMGMVHLSAHPSTGH